tara:strand:- start:119 stop:688 length:570 start_codon:yes stop_codon:yes gene_type:complete
MHRPGKTRYALLCGFALAGAAGSFGVAHAQQDMNNETSRAQELSQDIKKFNQNRGSLKENSAARAGTPTAHIDADGNPTQPMPADHERADELANEVRGFNRSGGSLNSDNAAQDHSQHPAGTPTEHPRADELANEVRDFNRSGGSLNRNSAADSQVNDELPASQHEHGGASATAQELDQEVTEHNNNEN